MEVVKGQPDAVATGGGVGTPHFVAAKGFSPGLIGHQQ